MFIIGFCGPQKAGKSTSASFFQTFWEPRTQVLHFATPILKTIEDVFGIKIEDYEKQKSQEYNIAGYVMTLRQFMQKIGTAYRSEFGGDFFVRMLHSKIEPDKIICIDDVRYPEEEKMIRSNGGIIVRINRNITQEALWHSSEQYHAKFKVDAQIENDSNIDHLFDALLKQVYPLIPKDIFLKPYKGYAQVPIDGILIDTHTS